MGYTPYYFLYGRRPPFQARNQPHPASTLLTSNDLNNFIVERGELFQEIMPLPMRNLAITQQCDCHRYRRFQGGKYG